jgi:RHS repeat-associated protein
MKKTSYVRHAYPSRFCNLLNNLLKKSTIALLIFSLLGPSLVVPISAFADDDKHRDVPNDLPKHEIPAETPEHKEPETPTDEAPEEPKEEDREDDLPTTEETDSESEKEDEARDEGGIAGEEEGENLLAQMSTKDKYLNEERKQNLPRVDEVTGALNYSIPIDVPPGRNGVQPNLSLVYNNQNKDNTSMFGLGWSLNIPYIERVYKVNDGYMHNTNEYFVSSLDGELVLISTSTNQKIFRPKIEHGDARIYTLTLDHGWNLILKWTVTDKHGSRFEFGHSTWSRTQFGNYEISKWMLQTLIDANNNRVDYKYDRPDTYSGEVYPEYINYTSPYGSTFKINFFKELRPDAITNSSTLFWNLYDYRINKIEVVNYVNSTLGSVVRRYDLVYSSSSNSVGSLLESLTESIQNGSGNFVELPPISFSYETINGTWIDGSNISLPPTPFVKKNSNGTYKNLGVETADVNGDSLVDFIYAKSGSTFKVYLNNGTSWTESSSFTFPAPLVDSSGIDQGARILDINGDGLPDVAKLKGTSQFYMNNGNNWVLDSSWVYPASLPAVVTNQGKDNGVRFADFNADGLPDLLYGKEGLSPTLYLNTGSGWSSIYPYNFDNPVTFVTSDNKDTGARGVDLNNDGWLDYLTCSSGASSVRFSKFISNYTVQPFPQPNNDLCFVSSNKDQGIRIDDVNQDGLLDFYKNNNGSTKTYLNTGSNLVPTTILTAPTALVGSNGYDIGTRLIDLNADGLTDSLRYYQPSSGSPSIEIKLRQGKPADVLKSISTSSGANVSVDYKMSTEYKDTNGAPLNPELPIQVQTVNKITVSDGYQTAFETTYSFEDGSYYFASSTNRKFAGFGLVTKKDAGGNITKTYFHQGNEDDANKLEVDHYAKIGKAYQVSVYGADGVTKYSKQDIHWEVSDLSSGRFYVKLSGVLNSKYDSTDNTETTISGESYQYDDNGNLIQKKSQGKYGVNEDGTYYIIEGDEITTQITYAKNEDNVLHIVSNGDWYLPYFIYVPIKKIELDSEGDLISDRRDYYDGSTNFGEIIKGNSTRQDVWAGDNKFISTHKEYDAFGNVVKEINPKGVEKSIEYDQYHLFPKKIATPYQTTEYEFDYNVGKPKWAKDANGTEYKTTYDSLGRVVKEEKADPEDSNEFVVTTEYEYDDSFPTSATKTDHLSEDLSVKSYVYYDGIGRVIQTRQQTEDSNVFSVKDTAYNNLGQKIKESLPYFSNGPAQTFATTTTSLWTTFTYDPINRIKNVSNAVGTAQTSYGDWQTTVIDPNGHQKDVYKDAYDRIVKVVEYNGSELYTTEAEYTPQGNVKKITDAAGNIRNFGYDILGRLVYSENLHAPTDTTFSTWAYSYDDVGNLISRVDGNGKVTKYSYDLENRLLTETLLPSDISLQANEPVVMTEDAQIQEINTLDANVVYTYDECEFGVGRICKIEKKAIKKDDHIVSEYEYDLYGRVAKEKKTINGEGDETLSEYDLRDNTTKIVLPDGSATKYEYNSAGQVERILKKEADDVEFELITSNIDYSPVGLITIQENTNGTKTLNTYDSNKMYRPVQRLTQAPWLESGLQPLAIGTPPLQPTNLLTNGQSNALIAPLVPISFTGFYDDPDTVSQGKKYDLQVSLNGTMSPILWQTSPNPFGAPTFSPVLPNGTQSQPMSYGGPTLTQNVPYYWRTRFHDDQGLTSPWSATTSFMVQTGGSTQLPPNKPTNVTINDMVNPTLPGGPTPIFFKAVFTDPDPTSTAIAYRVKVVQYWNAFGVPVYQEKWDSGIQNFATPIQNGSTSSALIYTGQPLSYFNKVYIQFFDQSNLEGAWSASSTMYFTTPSQGKTIQDLHYIYDPVGNITELSDFASTSAYRTVKYEYDPLDRLTHAYTTVSTPGNDFDETYSFDKIGNITQKNDKTGTHNYLYQGATESGNFANPHAVTEINSTAGSVKYEYDKNGNMIKVGDAVNTFDYNNRIIASTLGGLKTTYAYDAGGDRVIYSNGTKTVRYPNDLYNVTTETSAESDSGTTETITKHIFLGDESVATITQKTGDGIASADPKTTFIHTDHLSGSNVITDEAGAIAEVVDYYPQGGIRINEIMSEEDAPGLGEQRKFTGHEYDAETKLTYMRARYYDGEIGRFLSIDPMFLDVGRSLKKYDRTLTALLINPQEMNSYSYVLNNPMKYTDPTGEVIPLIAVLGFVLLSYAVADLAVDTYEHNITIERYPDQFSDQEKAESFQKIGSDLLLMGLGGAMAKVFGASVGLVFDGITAANDAVNMVQSFLDSNAPQNPTSQATYNELQYTLNSLQEEVNKLQADSQNLTGTNNGGGGSFQSVFLTENASSGSSANKTSNSAQLQASYNKIYSLLKQLSALLKKYKESMPKKFN